MIGAAKWPGPYAPNAHLEFWIQATCSACQILILKLSKSVEAASCRIKTACRYNTVFEVGKGT